MPGIERGQDGIGATGWHLYGQGVGAWKAQNRSLIVFR
jgi:hypothetical protein